MHRLKPLTTLFLITLLTSCGVPREAGRIAASAALESTQLPADDAAIRQSLTRQADRWTHLAALLQQQEFGGITGVNPKFTNLVSQTAALARRQRDLIAQNQDNPQNNRAALTRFHSLWQSANQYLNP